MFPNNHKLTIDLFSTKKPRSFHFSIVTEARLSDYHRLITTFMKFHMSRLKLKINLKDYCNFWRDLTSKILLLISKTQLFLETDDPN